MRIVDIGFLTILLRSAKSLKQELRRNQPHNAGVITNEEFAFFQNAGYMGSTELIANLFRISQTEEKLRKDKIQGADKATSVHYNVGKEVRTAIEKIGGTMPEDLPTPEKSIQQIEKEQIERLKLKAKKGKLMLDE